jgi:chemotaxis protein methyltransferase CheR
MSRATNRVFQNVAIDEIAKVISQITGNQFAEKHSSMLEFRLKKRCLELRIDTLDNYFHYFRAHQGTELNYLISLLTTHHTFFFREFVHFEHLEEKAIQALIPRVRARADKRIRIWSAACSKGHEVYSLAMFFAHTLKQIAPDVDFSILATDIDHESLTFGQNGVYTRKEIKEVPLAYLANHWARGTGEIADYVKAKASLKNHIQWMQANLLTLPETFSDKFDIIFCRNVFIYFNQNQVKQSSIDLLKHLHAHGYYYIGLSESLNGLGVPVVTDGPSIYRPLSAAETPKVNSKAQVPMPAPVNRTAAKDLTGTINSSTSIPATTMAMAPEPKEILRVLCVDDSPSILTLLKKVLAKQDGFEVIGTAGNGLEAAQKIKELQPDILTLDIHMPEQTGIEYLQRNFNSKHPPVVMVSSVSREESDLALKALQLGASDYVEKPALSNLREISDEIKRKLRSAYRNQQIYRQKPNLTLDEAFKNHILIKNPHNCLRIILGQISDKTRLTSLIKEFGNHQPPTFILIDGAGDTLEGFSKTLGLSIKPLAAFPTVPLRADEVYVADAKSFFKLFNVKTKETPVSILILGEVSPNLKPLMQGWQKAQILVEDLGTKLNGHSAFRDVQTDIVPVTSFAYMSADFLGKLP